MSKSLLITMFIKHIQFNLNNILIQYIDYIFNLCKTYPRNIECCGFNNFLTFHRIIRVPRAINLDITNEMVVPVERHSNQAIPEIFF